MRKELAATAAALAVMVAVPLFAGDTASPFAGDENRYFADDEDRFLADDDEDRFFAEDEDTLPSFRDDEDRASSFAEDTTSPGIDRRQRNQQRRIQYGKRIGAITPREAFRLERMLARIEHVERRFKADGHFTRAERTRIHGMLDRSGRSIQLAMRNGRVAP